MIKISYKNHWLIGFLFIIFCSCNDRLTTVVEELQPGVTYKSYQVDRDSLIQGEYLVYFEDGTSLFERSFYKDNILHGKRTLYYPNGNIEVIENYLDGVLTDTLIVLFENGNIQRKVPYIDGAINGVLTSFYPSGVIKEKVVFQNNLENGPFEEFYANGNIMWKGSFLNGDNEFGDLLHFDSLGNMDRKLVCDSNAICTTVWTNDL